MSIIDTHSHVFAQEFDGDIQDVISRAIENGVELVLLPNIDTSTIESLKETYHRFPTKTLPMMGLHPTSVTVDWPKDLEIIKQEFSNEKYIAVGEIGLDLYWDKSLEKEQKAAFEEQLRWSIEFDLPVSIHSRNAVLESVECIRRVSADKLKGVFHSFGGNKDELHQVLALNNFYIGVNGTVTYKNSTLPELLKGVDLSRIIVETDAPYLPPVPFRGKRNEPAYTVYIVDKLSTIFQVPKKEIEHITTQNAKRLFNIA